MATKQVSLRVGQQTLDNLRYLGILMRQSDAQIVTEWINTLADTIRIMADQAKNGGTILSLEEQQAVQTIQRCLRDLRIPGAQ